MSDVSFFRDKAEQALRLARQNTDPTLVKSLTELAQHYSEQAEAIDGAALGKEPEDE